MSTEKIYKSVVSVASRKLQLEDSKIMHLDVGAGKGELISLLGKALDIKSSACDYHIERFPNNGITIKKVDLNKDEMPYRENSFDLVTCSEVIEHLENYRKTIRDISCILKPGGVAIFTTPNILNMNSRARFFSSGFYNLFGPLPVKNDKLYSAGGHITPISYFYLAHALMDAGFSSIELDIDKRQRSSSVKSIIFYPFVFLGSLFFWKNEKNKYKTVTDENEPFVKKHFSWDILTARTIVVSAKKIA